MLVLGVNSKQQVAITVPPTDKPVVIVVSLLLLDGCDSRVGFTADRNVRIAHLRGEVKLEAST